MAKITTVEEALDAVRENIRAFNDVPKKLLTAAPEEFSAICLETVKRNDDVIKFIPEKLRTAEMCLEAVKNGGSLQYVPSHHLSGMETSRLQGDIAHIFWEMPEELRDEVRVRLRNEGQWVPKIGKDTTAINIGALTQEGICFEFDKLSTTFNMCFFDAYEAQCGKFSSFGSIDEFSNTPV